tara:strand:+ start:1203 stop:2018 length:816 start_codon:yes stop_codon:yes gene_type:complete
MANPTTNFGWVMPTATDLVTDLPADFDVFGQAVDTDFVGLKGGTTGQVLAKASATDLDFVWSADAAGMTNPMTTTGDIIYSSPGSTPVRLGIGSTDDVLKVTGGVPTWAAPAAGGGWTSIATGTLSGASTLVSFSPGAYYSVVIIVRGIKLSTAANVLMEVNGGSSNPNFGTNGTTSVQSSTGALHLTAGTTMAGNTYENNCFFIQFFNVQTESPVQQKAFTLGGFYQNSSSIETPVMKAGASQIGAFGSVGFIPSAGTFSGGSVKVYGVK